MDTLTGYIGDSTSWAIALTHPVTGAAFTPGGSYALVATLKRRESDSDANAVIQKASGAGITVSGSTATVTLVRADTEGFCECNLHFGIRATHASTGETLTVAERRVRLEKPTTLETLTSIDVVTTEDPLPFGGIESYVDDVETLPDYPTSFPTTPGDIAGIDAQKLIGRPVGTEGSGMEVGVTGGLEFFGDTIRRSAITGPVTVAAGSNTSAIADGALTITMVNSLQSVLDEKMTNSPEDLADLIAEDPAAVRAAAEVGSGATTWDGPVLPRTKARIASEAAAGAIRPFRLKQLVLGDSYGVNLTEELRTRVAPIREVGFGISNTTAGGAAIDQAQWTRTPNGGILWRLSASGHSVEYGGGTSAAAVECYRIKVFYQVEAGGGTFAVESNTNEAGWVEVPGATTASPINTDNSGAIGCAIFTYDFSTTELRRIRAKWVSGTVRILGFVLSDIREDVNSPRGGCAVYKLDVGGVVIANNNQCPQAIWNTILQDIQPDFVTIKGDDSNWTGVCGTGSSDLYQMIQTARPMDWIFIGRHPASASQYAGQGPPDNSGNELLSMDKEMRSFAIAQGQLWINPRKIHPPYATMTAASIISGDNTHLTPRGQAYENEAIMNILAASITEGWMMHKPEATTGMSPRYSAQPVGASMPAGKSLGFDMVGRTGTGGSATLLRTYFGVSKNGDDGEIGIHTGNSNEMRIFANRFGAWFFNHGTSGFGNGLAPTPRNPSAMLELHAGNRTTAQVLSLSGSSSHNAANALMTVRSGASTTTGTEGTTTFQLWMSGRIAPTIPTYANDAAADADAALLSGQLYKVGRAVFQKP